MDSVVALLRGINLGRKRRIPMQELRTMLESLGHRDVRTYLQSGNVVFEPTTADHAQLEQDIQAAIERTFSLDVAVAVRSADELAAIIDDNPMPDAVADPTKLHVVFLRDAPAPELVDALDPDRSPPDAFEVRGRHVYVRYPNGAGRTKLTQNYFERTLRTPATARNWRTVTKLRELASAD